MSVAGIRLLVERRCEAEIHPHFQNLMSQKHADHAKRLLVPFSEPKHFGEYLLASGHSV
jgi:hypothetical protein